tara:strand:- start:704 stop:877 length:174 start_codon:yes stop_codon:yes gene_type:complete
MFEMYQCHAKWGNVDVIYMVEARSIREAKQLFNEVKAGDDRLTKVKRQYEGIWMEMK